MPTVSIEGGGGQGAEAKVEVVDGAISDLLIEDYGINYSHDPENEVYDWIVKSDPNRSGEGFRAFVKISNGVLDEKQSVENGAILSTGIGYESILNKHGFVQIFDYNEGNGARGFVSKVNANGGITEITVTNGGESYNALDRNTSVIYILDSYNGVKHEGYGFLSNKLVTKSGIINSYEILDSGHSYDLVTYLVPVNKMNMEYGGNPQWSKS